MHVVLTTFLDDMTHTVRGPFATEAEACAWAANEAERLAGADRRRINADEDGFLVWLCDSDETTVWEWRVLEVEA